MITSRLALLAAALFLGSLFVGGSGDGPSSSDDAEGVVVAPEVRVDIGS